MDSVQKLSTTVWHQKEDGSIEAFNISTIERDSSAATCYPPPRFNETMVWALDASMKRLDIVAHVGDGPCFKQHMKMCEAFFTHGKFEEPEDEEPEPTKWYVECNDGIFGPYDNYEEAASDADRTDGIIITR